MTIERSRVTPGVQDAQGDLHLVQELSVYQGQRRTIDTINLEVVPPSRKGQRGRSRTELHPTRQAQLITLEDGEHLLMLFLDRTLCWWEADPDPLDQLHQRACNWLTEPDFENPPAPTNVPEPSAPLPHTERLHIGSETQPR